jgi:hypothetical protein
MALMKKFSVINFQFSKARAFTIMEFLLYIGIAGIFIAVLLPLISRLTRTISFYQSKVNLRNEFSKVMQKINYESQVADDLDLLQDWGIIFWQNSSSTELRLARPNLINNATITGFAWSYQAGGISLNCADNNGCSASNYQVQRTTTTTAICKVSTATSTSNSYVYSGYAWSPELGWIKFRDNQGGIEYGVCEEQNGDLRGWAWNDIVGWVSFNCVDSNVCDMSNYKIFQSQNRLKGYGYNSVIGWIRFDAGGEKIYLWKNGQDEQFTNNLVKAKSLNFENIGQTMRFNLKMANLDETKNIIGTSTLLKWSK